MGIYTYLLTYIAQYDILIKDVFAYEQCFKTLEKSGEILNKIAGESA